MESGALTDLAMELLLAAGRAGDETERALRAAGEGEFAEAEAAVDRAREHLADAHERQTDLIRLRLEDGQGGTELLVVHAMDTLANAATAHRMAGEIIRLNRRIENLEKNGGNEHD